MEKLSFVCFIGAGIRILFYRLLGNKKITITYLQEEKDEQQMISLMTGIGFFVFVGFIVSTILL